MWTHLFTLEALAHELHKKLHGTKIAESFTQRKNELLISAEGRSGTGYTIVTSIDPTLNFLFIRDRIPRAKKNAVDIFPELQGSKITNVSVVGHERIVMFQLDDVNRLYIQLFGTAESNVFLVENEGTISKSFKNSKSFKGKKFEHNDARLWKTDGTTKLASVLRDTGANTLFAALKSAIPFLGSTYAREILHRAKVEEKSAPHNLGIENIERIYRTTQELLEQSRKPTPTVYFRNHEPRVFSVIPLLHLSGAQSENYSSVNEAIHATVFRSLRTQAVESTKKELIKKLKAEYDRTQQASTAAREQLQQTPRAEQYERIANIIIANLLHLTKGTRAVDLENIFSEKQEQVRITMDPKLTPSQNAEQYFAKSKKARTARSETERRLGELEEKSTLLEKLLLHLDQCQTQEQVDEFTKENSSTLQRWNIVADKKATERIPFREFTVAGNFTVWVGKGSENNDLLTMKYAKPNDLWFHVRGASGSHAVLRVAGGKTQPSKEVITQAARIAAYYSKMRNASMVPVAYCERKYVRKPKRSEPGAVVMDREKVVFVEPGLPTEGRSSP